MTSPYDASKTGAKVIIVGAGPVGMLTALRLGQADIDTLVIEGHDTLLNTTRAVVYMPVVLPVLGSLGILDTIKQQALLNSEGVYWRDIEGKPLANLPISSPDSKHFSGVLILGQWRMNALVLEELKKYPSVEVRFGLKLTSIDNDPTSPTVSITVNDTKNPNATDATLTAEYILGTDGANSTTRQLLNLPFEGSTYTDFRMIGIDVLHDFIKHESFGPLNFIVHPKEWAVIVHTGQDEHGNSPSSNYISTSNSTSNPPANHQTTAPPQWRIAYGEDPSLPTDQASIQARAQAQIPKYIRPNTPFKLIRAEPYTISQRSASHAIVNRVALAGDALHCNNPIGGLGLTGGILDAFCYGNALIRVLCGGEPGDVLTSCAESRLSVWRDVTDPMSRGNLERLFAVDEERVRAREEMFGKLNGEFRDRVAGMVRKGLDGMMRDDFSVGTERWVGRGATGDVKVV